MALKPLNLRRYYIKWKERVAIAFSQETHLNQHGHEKLGKLASAQVFHSSHTSARRGAAILIRTYHAFQVEKVSPPTQKWDRCYWEENLTMKQPHW